jgi:hypothetical protein
MNCGRLAAEEEENRAMAVISGPMAKRWCLVFFFVLVVAMECLLQRSAFCWFVV